MGQSGARANTIVFISLTTRPFSRRPPLTVARLSPQTRVIRLTTSPRITRRRLTLTVVPDTPLWSATKTRTCPPLDGRTLTARPLITAPHALICDSKIAVVDPLQWRRLPPSWLETSPPNVNVGTVISPRPIRPMLQISNTLGTSTRPLPLMRDIPFRLTTSRALIVPPIKLIEVIFGSLHFSRYTYIQRKP